MLCIICQFHSFQLILGYDMLFSCPLKNSYVNLWAFLWLEASLSAVRGIVLHSFWRESRKAVAWLLKIEAVRFEDEILLFSRILKNYTSRKVSLYDFFLEKLAPLFLLKEVKPSSDSKVIKIPTFDDLFPSLQHSHQNSWYNDDSYYVFPPKWSWFTRAYYLVLRKSCSHKRLRI